RLLRQQNSLDIWQDSSLHDCHLAQKTVQFLIISDSQLQVTRYYSRFLHCPRAPILRQLSTPKQLLGRRGRRLQHARHSYQLSKGDARDQQEIGGPLARTWSSSLP
ncbi:hypothetical protein T265_13661, partial [Opisthorchis viverrini]